MHQTCIIIPCFNEVKRLRAETYKDFFEKEDVHFCLVNDGSKDATADILAELQAAAPEKVQVLNLNKNAGKAEAIRQGILKSCSSGKYSCVGFLDADLATPLEEISFLLSFFKDKIKVVLGSRVLRLGALVERNPLRHYSGRIFATIANSVLNLKVYDSQCGAKLFDSDLAAQLFSVPFQSRWLFDLELLYRLKKGHEAVFNQHIVEVPLRTWKEKGQSKIRPHDILIIPFELLRIKTAIKGYNRKLAEIQEHHIYEADT